MQKKIIRRYSESLRQQVVSEVENGMLTVGEAKEHYDIRAVSTIKNWLKTRGKRQRATQIVRVEMKDEAKRIRELEKTVADLSLKNLALESLIEAANERLGEDLKKKIGTEPLKSFEETTKKKKVVS